MDLNNDDNPYEFKFGQADQFFTNDNDVSDGILLIGNLSDPDHQRLQNGGFLLALNKKVATYRQLFKLYDINDDDLKKTPETIEEEYIEDYLNDNDVIQIIISNKDRMVDCEKFINTSCNKTLETLLKKGRNSELANLNSHIKCF